MHDPLLSRLAFLRITSRRYPLMAGFHDEKTGNGTAFGQVGRQGPWMWERTIRAGQWSGPWRRIRWRDEARG